MIAAKERVYRNIKTKWLVLPEGGPTLLGQGVLRLVRFEIDFFYEKKANQKKEGVSVYDDQVRVRLFYTQDKGLISAEPCKEYQGPAAEVYAFILENKILSNQSEFRRAWSIARTKGLKTIINTPYKPADTGVNLYDLVFSNKITPKEFAKKTGNDYANVFREIRSKTPLTLNKAVEYSKILNCDPVDLLFDPLQIKIWGHVDLYKEISLENRYVIGQIYGSVEEQYVNVPRDIYKPNLNAIQIKSNGSYLHNKIAYYYRSDEVDVSNHNNKLVIAGMEDDALEDFGLDSTSYFFGIYTVEKGGRQTIYNPDPFASKKIICDNQKIEFSFIAPVVSLTNPDAMEKDYNYHELNANYKKIEYGNELKNQLASLERTLREKKLEKKDLTKTVDLFSKTLKEMDKIKRKA